MPAGRVVYDVWRRHRLIEHVDQENLVVTLGQTILANALGGTTAGGVITQFGVGSNLNAPVAGNTVLTGQFLRPITSVTYPTPGSVAFGFELGTNDANGVQIGEFGLLTASGLLFARKVRQAGLSKTSEVALSGVWTITW